MLERASRSGVDNNLELQAKAPAAPYFAYWFLALYAVTQIPLYLVQYPDITDFPNHLARLHVLLNFSESEPLQRYYVIRELQIGTNLAMEVLVPVLARWMGALLALKMFASLSILLMATGAVALGRVIAGRFSYLLLGVLIFAHNAMFQLGLLNYLFGLGMALWLLSAWILARSYGSFRYGIAFAVGCSLVYFCHLSALGVYAVGVFGYELGYARAAGCVRSRSTSQAMLMALIQFIPVAMIHTLWSSSAGSYVPAPIVGSWLESSLVWLVYKALLLVRMPLICVSGYLVGQSVFGFLLVFGLYFGFRERVLKLDVHVRWIACALAVAILLLPHAGFGSNLVDIRLLPALGLVLWSGLEIRGRSKLMPNVVLCGIASCVLLITLETAWEWHLRDAEYRQVRGALVGIPERSKIAVVVLDEEANSSSISPHAVAWTVIDRSAFLSNFYIWPFQPFWVGYREPYVSLAKLARTDAPGAPPPTYESLKMDYDYILVFGGNESERTRYSPNAETVISTKSLRFIRVREDRPT